MKKAAHLLGYLFRRQLPWLIAFWMLVAVLVVLANGHLPDALVIGALGLVALVIVIRVHDHLGRGEGEGVLRTRPVDRKNLMTAELVFLFVALVLPAIMGSLMVLLSFEARSSSYLGVFVLLVLLSSQLALWYVAGSLARSFFGAFVLVLFHYLPVVFIWSVVEFRNNHGTIEITVYLVLGVVGLLSLLLLVFPLSRPFKVAFFVGSSGALLLALSGIEWDHSEPMGLVPGLPGDVPAPDESITVEFAAAPPADADPMKDSHWDFFKISSDRIDEIFVPQSLFGKVLPGPRVADYRWYAKWENVEMVMLGDLILRNLPAGTDLRGREPTLRHYLAAYQSDESRMVSIKKEKKVRLLGEKYRLVLGGRLPLKVGSSNAEDGYRATIRKVDFLPTKLSLQVEISWILDSLVGTKKKRGTTAWVLYSPSSQRGVLASGQGFYSRWHTVPDLVERHREFLEFPLPRTFAGADDVELHVFYLKEGKSLQFEVAIPPGEYSVR